QPHAVDDRAAETREQRRVVGGVDGVVVARDLREGAHVGRGDDHGVAATAARRVGDRLAQRTPGADRIGELGGAGAAADRETLGEGGDDPVAGTVTAVGGDDHVDLDDTPQVGVGDTGDLGLDTQEGGLGGQAVLHVD